MKTITKLAYQNNRKNPVRSVLIILAVVLTSTLLTAIALFGYTTIKYERTNAEYFYGTYYGAYLNVSEDQLENMEKRAEFDRLGRATNVGKVKSDGNLGLMWVSQDARNMANLDMYLEEGRFPETENEITGQKVFFQNLGYETPEIGQKVQLEFRKSNKEPYQSREFVISGFMENPQTDVGNQNFTAYVSWEFYENNFPLEERAYQVYFSMDKNMKLNSDTAEEKAKELAELCGIDPQQIVMNDYYLVWGLDPGMETIVGCAAVAILVIVFAILVIYNIFQVGVQQKIQEYGKVKALGTTRKQMRQLIFREGMMLTVVGIPAGLLLGIGITEIFFHYWMETSMEVMGKEGSFNFSMISFPMLLLCVVVTIFAVYLALRKPMKTVEDISPIEAIRFQERGKKNQGVRKGFSTMSVSKMTRANMAVNKKHTISTMTIMGISGILFVVVANFTGNMRPETEARRSVLFGDFQLELDYSTSDEIYPENNLDEILKNNELNQQLLDQIQKIDGVEQIRCEEILCSKNEQGIMDSVAVLDREEFEKEKKHGHLAGTVDYDKISEENGILYSSSRFLDETGFQLGDTFAGNLSGDRETMAYTGKIMGAFGAFRQADWIITEDTYKNLGFQAEVNEGSNLGTVWIFCEKDKEEKAGKQIEAMAETLSHVGFSTYKDELVQAQQSVLLMKILGYGLLLFVGVITYLNMANTIIMNIITRKRELGVMQALGMTNRQLNQMLRNEGLIFLGGSLAITLLLGMPLGYGVFCYGRNEGWFGLVYYTIPWKEILGMVILLIAMQLLFSFLLSRNVKKESLIERIRYQE